MNMDSVEPMPAHEVTIVVTNHNTLHLLKQCIGSLLEFYPDMWTIVLDSGSGDGSVEYIVSLAGCYENIVPVVFGRNVGHGPALHYGMMMSATPYVLTFDSDCVLLKGGLLEDMSLRMRADDHLYGIGWLRMTDFNGVENQDMPVRYIHPCCGMYNRQLYQEFPPFVHCGAPVICAMVGVMNDKTVHVESFDVFSYVKHMTAGTRRMYGGRWDPKDTEAPGIWSESANFPI